MWANNIDGEIKVFKYLPHSWEGENVYYKGFSSAPVAVREQEGFFEIVDLIANKTLDISPPEITLESGAKF